MQVGGRSNRKSRLWSRHGERGLGDPEKAAYHAAMVRKWSTAAARPLAPRRTTKPE